MKRPYIPIKKVCLPTFSKDPRIEPEKPFLYVDISSIERTMKIITQTPEILGADAPSRARKVIKSGDILVSTVRPNLNAIAVVPKTLDNEIASTGFCVLRPNKELIVGTYLFYSTLTSYFIDNLTEKVRGAHYPAVSDNDVKAVKIPLPAISEQRKIVEILDQAERLRKLRADADAKAQRILPALFIKMFGDPATNPKGLPVEPLSEVTSIIYRYPTFYGVDYVPDGVLVVRISNICKNNILSQEIEDYVKVPKEFSDRFPLTILRPFDIVMAVRGDTTGKIGLVPSELTGANISPNLIRISANPKKIIPVYLFCFLLLGKTVIGQFINDTAKKSITAKNLKDLPVIVPKKEDQVRFSRMIGLNFHNEQNQLRNLLHVERLFKILLHRAFTGDLTAKWREAHMKELLQEMERQSSYLEKMK